MENKRKRTEGSDIDKAIAKVGRAKANKLKTDEPLAEKDEVKQAEEELRRRLNKKQISDNEASTEQKKRSTSASPTCFLDNIRQQSL